MCTVAIVTFFLVLFENISAVVYGKQNNYDRSVCVGVKDTYDYPCLTCFNTAMLFLSQVSQLHINII